MTGPRFETIARWISAPLLGLILYWGGLTAWFQKDDFAWLSLRVMRAQGASLASLLFTPYAQGTIRTLSERVYYLSLSELFGLNPLPFRVVAFLTFAAVTVMLQVVGTRLTGFRAAGWVAALLWTVNAALATPLSWTAVYYELLCALFFLIGAWLLLRYIDTGDRRFFLAQWAAFLAGFFVLELNVVYPALATVLVLCCSPNPRKMVRQILPLFLASVAYIALHFWAAPLPAAGPYKLYWNWHIVPTLFTYVNWSLGTGWLRLVNVNSSSLRLILALLLGGGMGAFLAWKLRKREWTVLVYPAWFLIVLAPLLPLRFHMQYEYLTVPLLGPALWGGAAAAAGWSAAGWKRICTTLLLTVYLGVGIPVGLAVTASFHDRSIRIRDLFHRVEALVRDRPDRTVLLKGVDEETFNDVLYHRAFRLIGVNSIYVLSEDQARLTQGGAPADAAMFFIDPESARRELSSNNAVVYDLTGGNVTDVTSQYRGALVSASVDLGSEEHASQLGSTWYPREGAYRWMPKVATVTLRGPRSPSEKLHLQGFCPRAALRNGPVKLSVTAGGDIVGSASVGKPDTNFELTFDLPAKLTGQQSVALELELDKTFRASGDSRDLGLIFSRIEIR